MMLVKDAMTEDIVSIHFNAVIDAAIDLMIEKNVSGLPVVASDGRLVGIITEYDVLKLYGQPAVDSQRFEPCTRYMKTDVRTIQQDASLEVGARVFQAASIRRVMVLDGDKLVGVLSRRDIVRRIRDQRLSAVGSA